MSTDMYDDIIGLPHHVSANHPPMSMYDRAAQFAPFAALTGYGEAITETGRLTDSRRELDESEKAVIDMHLQFLKDHLSEKPEVSVTYFAADSLKAGGSYKEASGVVAEVSSLRHALTMADGTTIPIEDIFSISGEDIPVD